MIHSRLFLSRLFVALCSLTAVLSLTTTARGQSNDPRLDSLIAKIDAGDLGCQEALDSMSAYYQSQPVTALSALYLARAYDKSTYTWCGLDGATAAKNIDSALRYYKKARAIDPHVRQIQNGFSVNVLIGHLFGGAAVRAAFESSPANFVSALKRGFEEGGFSPGLLEWAEFTLRSADTNAIILTFGDDDTFPLWYLQAVRHIRPDISIINTSLAGSPEYRKLVPTGLPGVLKPVQLTEPSAAESGFEATFNTESPNDSLYQILWSEVDTTGARDTIHVWPEARQRLRAQLGRPVPAVLVTRAFKLPDPNDADLGPMQFALVLRALKANGWVRPVYSTYSGRFFAGADSLMRRGPVLHQIFPVSTKGETGIWLDTVQCARFLREPFPLKVAAKDSTMQVVMNTTFAYVHAYATRVLGGDSIGQKEVDRYLASMRPFTRAWTGSALTYYGQAVAELAKEYNVKNELRWVATTMEPSVAVGLPLSPAHHTYAYILYELNDCKKLGAFVKGLEVPDQSDWTAEDKAALQEIYDFSRACGN